MRVSAVFVPLLCLAACAHPYSNEVTAENAPRDVAHSGLGYVVLESYGLGVGLSGYRRDYSEVMFVNTRAPHNPFYLRTPDDMKLQTMPLNLGRVWALQPGTYGLALMWPASKQMALFDPAHAPVQFTVRAGEMVYLGALTFDSIRTGGFLDGYRHQVTFQVVDAFPEYAPQVQKTLALMQGAPPITTRLMTVLQPQVTVDKKGYGWVEGMHPQVDPPAGAPAPEPAPPPPESADAPWHETPSQ